MSNAITTKPSEQSIPQKRKRKKNTKITCCEVKRQVWFAGLLLNEEGLYGPNFGCGLQAVFIKAWPLTITEITLHRISN